MESGRGGIGGRDGGISGVLGMERMSALRSIGFLKVLGEGSQFQEREYPIPLIEIERSSFSSGGHNEGRLKSRKVRSVNSSRDPSGE